MNEAFRVPWLDHDVALQAPEMLGLLVLAPALLYAATRSLADLPRPLWALSVLLRCGLLATVALALSQPHTKTDATRVSTVVLVDVSDSASDEDLAAAGIRIRELHRARGDDDLQLVTFAATPKVVRLDDTLDSGFSIERHAKTAESDPGIESDPAAALRLAYGLMPAGHLRRVLLISDGLQTRGNLMAEAQRGAKFGVRVHTDAMRGGGRAEVAVTELALPTDLEVGKPFQVRATVRSTGPAKVRARLYQGPVLNGLQPLIDRDLEAGENLLEFESIVRTPGKVTYRVELEPEGGDQLQSNNRFVTSAIVPGRTPVLIVAREPSRVRHLAQALGAAEYEVDVRSATAMPRTMAELERYDFFILSDVAAEALGVAQMELIRRYVRDTGGGFLMAGGDQSFGPGGYHGTAIEQLPPVRMDSQRRRDEHTLALALVIDCSGSMSGPKMELAKEAARASAEVLSEDDSIVVVGFASQPARKVRMQRARNRMKIAQNIGRLTAQGGTAILPALDTAYQDLSVVRARVKHVILLTDGQTNEVGIEQTVRDMRAENITVTAVGLGADVNRSLLQEIASIGGGRVYFTNDPHNIPRIFVRETTQVARNDAVEDLFIPLPHEPADFLKGVDLRNAPFLRGYVATQAKSRPAQVILQSELGEPVLARWRAGLGWALAWTSDVKNRWAVDWIRWKHFGRFWSQLAREHMRQVRRRTLPMVATLRDDRAHVQVDALSDEDAFMNGLQSTVRIEGPLGAPVASKLKANQPAQPVAKPEATDIEQPLRQTAPGRYEAQLPIDGYGAFVLEATHRKDGVVIARSRARLSRPYPAEHRILPPDQPLLAMVASVTGGASSPPAATVFDAGGESILRTQPLWPPLVWIAVCLFLLDLLVRRLRLPERASSGPVG